MYVKHFLIATAALLVVSSAALAMVNGQPAAGGKVEAAAGSNATAPAAPAAASSSGSFDAMKANVLQQINDRIADMQKRQSCIQAAADSTAFTACFPQQMGRRPETPPAGAAPSKAGDKPAH